MATTKKQLFQVAILLHPKKKGETELIQEPKFVLGESNELVGKLAFKKLPAKYDDAIDRIEVLVRPF